MLRLAPCVCMPSPIPRQDRWDHSLVLSHRLRPSPYLRRVSSCVIIFGACSAFTFVTACILAESPKATLCTEGFSGFVASTTAPIATGRSEPVSRAGLPRCGPAPFHGARKYLNNVVEQDHRTVKKRTWLAKGYGSLITAWRTLQGIEAVEMIRKGWARWVAREDSITQANFIGELFGLAT